MKVFVLRVRYIIIALAIAVLIPTIYFSCTSAVTAFNANSKKIPIYSVKRDDNMISLSFDCAWNDDDIDSILNTLDNYNIKASFFITGVWAEKYPKSVQKIYTSGHDIGNHSYNHSDYTKMSEENIIKDLDKCDDIIFKIINKKPTLMRAPSGGYNNTVMSAAENSGRKYIQWSIDGLDYVSDATEASIQKRISRTENGDIILMHNGTKLTSTILPHIIESLSDKYEFVKVSELIYDNNYTINNSGRQIKQ